MSTRGQQHSRTRSITGLLVPLLAGGLSLGHAPAAPAVTLLTPVKSAPVTSPFSIRFHPIRHIWREHKGIDFGVPKDTSVYAAHGGILQRRPFDQHGFGNYVVIRDAASGISTLYGHLNSILVPDGPVVAGQRIALSGNTGGSSGPHLHFEVRIHDQLTDPLNIINAPGAGTMAQLGAARNQEYVRRTGKQLPPYFKTSITIAGGQAGTATAPTMGAADPEDQGDPGLANGSPDSPSTAQGAITVLLIVIVILMLGILIGLPLMAKLVANLMLRAGSAALRQAAKAGQGMSGQ